MSSYLGNVNLRNEELLGRIAMTKHLDNVFKSRNINFLTSIHIVKAIVFPLVMYECGSWAIKKAEH